VRSLQSLSIFVNSTIPSSSSSSAAAAAAAKKNRIDVLFAEQLRQ
jgi:hypothetical protein